MGSHYAESRFYALIPKKMLMAVLRARVTGPVDLDSILPEGVAEHSSLPTSSPGGDHLHAPRADSAIDRALQSISDLEVLRSSQHKDYFLGKVKSDLLQTVPRADTLAITECYLLDDNDLLWYKSSEQK